MIKSEEARLDNLHIGKKVNFTLVISESMIEEFAKLSGDYNPHHIDDAFAKQTYTPIKINPPTRSEGVREACGWRSGEVERRREIGLSIKIRSISSCTYAA